MPRSEALKRAQKRWRAANPDKIAVIERRRSLKKFGLTESDYDRMLQEQRGVCGGCGNPPKSRRLGVDRTRQGVVRGLLCNVCRHILGVSRQNERRLQGLIDYLKDWRVE